MRRAFVSGLHGRESWRAVTWFAVLLALPLVVFGIFAALLIDADYAVTRTRELSEATDKILALGRVAGGAVEVRADDTIDRIGETLLDDHGSDTQGLEGRLRLVGFTNEARFLFVRRPEHRIFPPENGGTYSETDMLRRFAGAIAAARSDLVSSLETGPSKTGLWSAADTGLSFVRCARDSSELDICVIFDEATLDPVLRVALNAATRNIEEWLLVLRDPAGRVIWSHGPSLASTTVVSELTGSMRGWHMEASLPPRTHRGLLPLTAIILPLIFCWLFVVWYMHRSQQVRLLESRFRSEMTAKLSHDLRTPIANLRLYADLVARRSGDEMSVRRYCDVLRAEIERLALLADNTIVYGRAPVPEPLRFDEAVPDAVLDATIERYENLFAAASCTIVVEREASKDCRFDRMGFERILINLLDNACKYAPGRIEVATRLEHFQANWGKVYLKMRESQEASVAGRLFLSVRDFGPGLDERFKARLVGPPRGSIGAKDGFGLGLTVVRELVEANGGKVTIENLDPGLRLTISMKIATVCPREM